MGWRRGRGGGGGNSGEDLSRRQILEGYGTAGGLQHGEAKLRLLLGRGVGCRRGGMELEEEETLGRSTGIYYKATTRGGAIS